MKWHYTSTKTITPIVRGSLIYTFSSALNAIIPFLLIPILTTHLTTVEFGIVSTFMVSNAIFVILIGIDQQSFISVNFFSKKVAVPAAISSVLLIGFTNFVFLLVVALFMTSPIENIFEISSTWILISIAISFIQFISQLNLTIWQLRGESIKYGCFQILNSLLNYGISIYLIINVHLGEQGRIWGISITAILFGLYSFYNLLRSNLLIFSFEKNLVKASLAFSLPLLPHALAGWINSGLDRILINNFVGVAATGVYSVGYQIGMAVGIVASSFNRAFAPILFEKLTTNRVAEKSILIKYTYTYYVVLIVFALFLYLMSPLILRLFVDERYEGSKEFIGWIILGFTADGLYYGVVNYIYFSKRTIFISIITFSSCIIHFIITYSLLPTKGAMAAAYSTAITYVFSFILAWIVSYKIYPMPWFSFRR